MDAVVTQYESGEFLASTSAWEDLRAMSAPSFYQTRGWLNAVHSLTHEDDQEHVTLSVTLGGALAAIIPLTIRQRRGRLGRYRQVEVDGNIYSPRRYVLGRSDLAEEVAVAFRRWLDDHDSGWGKFCWDDAGTDDPFFLAFRNTFGSGGKAFVAEKEENIFTEVAADDDAEAYFRSLSRNTRNNISRAINRLSREYDVSICRFEGSTPEFALAIDDYYEVYANSWKEPERHSTFHRLLPSAVGSDGTVLLYVLYVRAHQESVRQDKLKRDTEIRYNPTVDASFRPAATYYFVRRGREAYFLKTAYAEDYKAVSPGTGLRWFVLRDLIDKEGCVSIDYQKGAESYKSKLGSRAEGRVRLTALNPRARIVCAEHWLFERLRDLRALIRGARPKTRAQGPQGPAGADRTAAR